MNTEKLHVKIGLSATYWDRKPSVIIGVDDIPYFSATIEEPSDNIFYVEFDIDVVDGIHALEIALTNKQDSDTVKDNYQNPDNYTIVKDMTVNIHSVEIDELDLGQMVFNESVFELFNPIVLNGESVTKLERCVNLGFNGKWSLKFESPFYLWLLEKM
jgi:hypothetical protein